MHVLPKELWNAFILKISVVLFLCSVGRFKKNCSSKPVHKEIPQILSALRNKKSMQNLSRNFGSTGALCHVVNITGKWYINEHFTQEELV